MSNKITLIKKENVMKAYDKATSAQKELLENLFGKEMFHPQDIKERVKTFADAVAILGNDNQAVIDYYAISDKTCTEDILAFAKLRVIAEALNEGWKPSFSKDEYRYYPWFNIYSKEEFDNLDEYDRRMCRVVGRGGSNANADCGLVCAVAGSASSHSGTDCDSRLVFKTGKLAEYCGEQFIDIWADYLFA